MSNISIIPNSSKTGCKNLVIAGNKNYKELMLYCTVKKCFITDKQIKISTIINQDNRKGLPVIVKYPLRCTLIQDSYRVNKKSKIGLHYVKPCDNYEV